VVIETVKAGPRANAETGLQVAACLAACSGLNTAASTSDQSAERSRPSPEAISVARDLTFDALAETAALAESYSRSLGEAAWRADPVTVETHLRQLRACVIGAIDVFKMLNGVETKGSGA
jgi:hypothetical protein